MGTRPPPPTQPSPSELISLLQGKLALAERIDVAHELARLGDPRLVVDRVAIPAGPLLRGEPLESSHLAAYAIDRFPVTVAAYSSFVAAGGYQARRYWSVAGWAWRTSESIEFPRFWGETEWASYLVANHPVVGVGFHEAEAYAAFAGARLPTHAEWEKSASGTDGRKYPWGNEWIDDACGMRGVGPRSTVPIGVFPRGRSAYGVSDLVGCVWQWCSDLFVGWGTSSSEDSATKEPSEGDAARRITCGGAWNTLPWSVTCQSRNGYPPTARFSNLGFRCVVSSVAADSAEKRR